MSAASSTAPRYDADPAEDDQQDDHGRPLCGDCESPLVYDNRREQYVHATDVECFLHKPADDLAAAIAVWEAAGVCGEQPPANAFGVPVRCTLPPNHGGEEHRERPLTGFGTAYTWPTHVVSQAARRSGARSHEYRAVCSCGVASEWFTTAGMVSGWEAQHRIERTR